MLEKRTKTYSSSDGVVFIYCETQFMSSFVNPLDESCRTAVESVFLRLSFIFECLDEKHSRILETYMNVGNYQKYLKAFT